MNRSKKDNIPLSVKNNVWKKYSYNNGDIRFAQCCTCENLVMIPESIRKYYNVNYDILQIFVNGVIKGISGVGEFGHIISEKNGGKAIQDNLIIQCKYCNTSNGSDNIDYNNINNRDSLMIDYNENLDIEMGVSTENCSFILKSGCLCKNKSLFNRYKFHIYINK